MKKFSNYSVLVMPAKAGIQKTLKIAEKSLDASFRWHDKKPDNRIITKFIILIVMACITHVSWARPCPTVLWPNQSASLSVKNRAIQILQKQAKKSLKNSSHPIQKLNSAGKLSKQDADLIASQKSFRDADSAAVLALMYTLNEQPAYLNKAKSLLLGWSAINQPTGNPIDETRLAGFVWAYDLLSCHFSLHENMQITTWLEKLRDKKNIWRFGKISIVNNHHIHQLKMLLLLDKVLNNQEEWNKDVTKAKYYSTINIDSLSGQSIDFKTRTALYYHNFDLQPWLEINLLSHCCRKPIQKAFDFLINRIRTHQINGEFLHSQAKIDADRAKGGFRYAKTNSVFEITRASPTIIAFYTSNGLTIPEDLKEIIDKTKSSAWLSFLLARKILWNNSYRISMHEKSN